MAGLQTGQIINGQPYQAYTPEWYQAQEQDAIHRAGVGGTAAGTGDAAYFSKVSPSLSGLYSASGLEDGSGSGSRSWPTVGYPQGSYPQSPARGGNTGTPSSQNYAPMEDTPTDTIAPIDLTAANTAAFATAKDQAANTAQASMTGLQSALSARGMGGAGYEAGQIGQTLSREANTIGAASRSQAQHEANLRAQQTIANLNAQVAQRGQTLGAKVAQRGQTIGADVTQRGQTIGAQEADANRQAETENAAAQRAAVAAGNTYSGEIMQRGQNIQSAQAAADLAQRAAAQKSSQTLSILQAVMGARRPSGSGGVPGYVY